MNYILYKACEQGHIEVVKELLNHNANIESKNTKGKTPLILGILLYYSVI
jgi:ankyrin repeat protein